MAIGEGSDVLCQQVIVMAGDSAVTVSPLYLAAMSATCGKSIIENKDDGIIFDLPSKYEHLLEELRAYVEGEEAIVEKVEVENFLQMLEHLGIDAPESL